MLKPSFRLFIVPLGAVSMIATLASQNAPQQPQRDSVIMQIRQQVVDCGQITRSPTDICVLNETPAR